MYSASAATPSTHPTQPGLARRFAVDLDVLLQGDGEAQAHRTTVVDASTRGLHVHGEDVLLRVGDGVTVTIDLGGEAVPITVRGRIVGRRDDGDHDVVLESLRPLDRGRLGGHLVRSGRPLAMA